MYDLEQPTFPPRHGRQKGLETLWPIIVSSPRGATWPPSLPCFCSDLAVCSPFYCKSLAELQLKKKEMGSLKPTFAYTVVYVKDVAEMVQFYAKAFGYAVRRLDESHRWGELEAGQTTIAFTPARQHETDAITGVVHLAGSTRERPPIELCFVYDDVDQAFQRAVENGAAPISMPEEKEWGQKVGYVRDLDGNVIRLGSPVRQQ